MWSPVIMGFCHIVASVCLEEGEKDVSKKQLVSLNSFCVHAARLDNANRDIKRADGQGCYCYVHYVPRFLWPRICQRPLGLQCRGQLTRLAHKGRSGGDKYELARRLCCCPNHQGRAGEPAMAILPE